MKRVKKLAAFIAVAAVATAGVTALAACGGDSGNGVVGTYKVDYSSANISGNVEMNGYLVALQCTETNTLVLKDDSTYEYTKYLIQHKDTSGYTSAASYEVAPMAETVDENILFSWTSAGDGACTLDFNKDGTYKFVYTTMSMTETGTWKWDNWAMTLTQSNENEITVTMDSETHALSVHYVAVAGGGALYHDFTCSSDVWGGALGGSGSYTPVNTDILFSWTSAGDGACTLDFNKDGTYKFVYTTMGLTETGTWTWENWSMKIKQSNDNEISVTMDSETHALNVHYVAVAGGGALNHEFTCSSDVWGGALGGSGSYTPVEGGGNQGDENQGETTTSGSTTLEITYVFKGTYTYEGDTVTLNPATSCAWKEDWGALRAYGFLDCSGTEVDKVVRSTAYGENDPLGYFGGIYFYSSGNVAVKVKLIKGSNTFEYIEESVFD
jgi:hypothetical protein